MMSLETGTQEGRDIWQTGKITREEKSDCQL